MTKAELADYAANLVSLMVSKETAGLPRGATIAREYQRTYDELMMLIKEDELNEAGKFALEQQRPEGGTTKPGSEPGRSGSAGPSDGQSPGGDTVV